MRKSVQNAHFLSCFNCYVWLARTHAILRAAMLFFIYIARICFLKLTTGSCSILIFHFTLFTWFFLAWSSWTRRILIFGAGNWCWFSFRHRMGPQISINIVQNILLVLVTTFIQMYQLRVCLNKRIYALKRRYWCRKFVLGLFRLFWILTCLQIKVYIRGNLNLPLKKLRCKI